MGFLASGSKSGGKKDALSNIKLLHKLQCRVCPLDKIKENEHPHMKPTGASEPLVYILGEAPGKAEDASGKHFVGKSGKLIRERIPKDMLPFIRFNNCVRTRPLAFVDGKETNATPEKVEIECCRPSVEGDIAATKPKAIFGFGNIPLQWALGQGGVYRWRGRRAPVDIGGHVCWYYQFEHPASLLRKGKRGGRYGDNMRPDEIGSEDERAFVFDLKRAFDEVEALPEPYVYSQAEIAAGVELIECSDRGLAKIEEYLRWAKLQHVVGVDLETNRLRPYEDEAKILTMAIGTKKHTIAFALDHREATWTKAQRLKLEDLLHDFLRDPSVKKTVHQLGFEHEWLAVFYGADVLRAGDWECSMQQATTLDERFGEKKCFSLDFLCLQYFGIHLKSLSAINKDKLDDEPLEVVLRYNGYDAKFHCLLFLAQRERLEAEGLQHIYVENRRSVPTLVLSQIKGIPVDQKENKVLSDEYEGKIAAARAKIDAIPQIAKFRNKRGDKFSPAANEDVAAFLHSIGCHDFEGVNEAELIKIDHPLIGPLIEFRKASKVLSTYIIPYTADHERGTVWGDGLLHPIFNPFGTVTNRTSSEYPNVQNIPKRKQEAKRVRKRFRLKNGLVISIDYGQIQARGIAMFSKDKAFVKSLWERYDVHQEWAERLAKAYPRVMDRYSDEEKPMKAFRGDVKNQWTFPLFFGSDLRARSEQLGIPEDYLKPEYDKFWKTFSGVRDWQERLISDYEKYGIVRHLDGRLNRAPISLNQVINYPIQGVERQIVMNAMNKLSELATSTGDINYQPNIMIHDDLTWFFEADAAERVDDYVETFVTKMLEIDFDFINVPLTVEVSIGEDMHKMDEVLVASSDEWKKAA